MAEEGHNSLEMLLQEVMWMLGTKLKSLQEQRAFLTTKLFLQSLIIIL